MILVIVWGLSLFGIQKQGYHASNRERQAIASPGQSKPVPAIFSAATSWSNNEQRNTRACLPSRHSCPCFSISLVPLTCSGEILCLFLMHNYNCAFFA